MEPLSPRSKFRWEWRAFGRRFGGAETRIARLPASDPVESDEVYLLVSRNHNVKVRDALLDLKVLREVNAAGLEQWAPRLDGRAVPDRLVGMGGAVTNVTAVSLGLADYDPDAIQGAVVTAAEIDRQIELYRALDADERRSVTGLQPNRGAVILAGACHCSDHP